MSEQHGVKETKELVMAVNELSLAIIREVKDGVQVKDALALVAKMREDGPLKDALEKAVADIAKVPSEVSDLDLSEGFDLGMVQLRYVPKYIQALI